MIPPQSLGSLSNVQEMLVQLVEDFPGDCNRNYAQGLPSMGWLLGRSVYLELHLLREQLSGDADLAGRVRHFFGADAGTGPERENGLPPRNHLLAWAAEIHDEHLTRLANPGMLPDSPLLDNGWLVDYLAQRHAEIYELMLANRVAKAIQDLDGTYLAEAPLSASEPLPDASRVDQGHYRVGARDGVCMDRESPAQMVELHSYKISRRPVSNAEFLAFMHAGGYTDETLWDAAGRSWRANNPTGHPWHWRQDGQGSWYGVGVNGPADLQGDEPVSGLSAHESNAFAAWASASVDGMAGAVVQHEYQWEVAARLGLIEHFGRAWEWCANPLHAYPAHAVPAIAELRSTGLDGSQGVMRGGCLHTLPLLRRASYRAPAPTADRWHFSGTRLVIPPGKAAWE